MHIPKKNSLRHITMAVQLLSPREVDDKLLELYYCLSSLPQSISSSAKYYNFVGYGPDPEDVENFGSEDSAVNHSLEVTFCPEGRKNGIQLKERGPGLVAVVDVLRKYNKQFPGNAVLQKWIGDLLESALKAGGSVRTAKSILLLQNSGE